MQIEEVAFGAGCLRADPPEPDATHIDDHGFGPAGRPRYPPFHAPHIVAPGLHIKRLIVLFEKQAKPQSKNFSAQLMTDRLALEPGCRFLGDS